MAKWVFFLGPAGAGKTTLAKALARRRPAVLLDMDTLLRPAAEAIMTVAGLDPADRDSPDYKRLCRELGYRITMDAARENAELGADVYIIGPFTKETEDLGWLERELARANGPAEGIETRVVWVSLASDDHYRERIIARGLETDEWKLANWEEFRRSLKRRDIRWSLPDGAVLAFDNTGPLTEEKLREAERFVGGVRTR